MSHNHICGCFFVAPDSRRRRQYLSQTRLESHTTVNPVSFTTELTQVFHNPLEQVIPSLQYAFPLYDGVAVSAYTITYDNKTLVGRVKQKDQARQTYQAAVSRGETAGLLESLPAGIFGLTLGNVPSKSDVLVKITYCGELKHDASIDGLRYVLPTSIAPRYGSYPGDVLQPSPGNSITGSMSIIVDFDMGKSAIRRVQSPSHPIALSMGELSTASKDHNQTPPFSPSHASVTLTKGTTELGDDFIVQCLIDDISRPQAILEVHTTLPAQRAIMATLVPRFALPPANPEIVFICDQSGSMGGSKNAALVRALKVFLKSLPLGVRFNICAFGNDHKFLWPKSQAYNENNVNQALGFVDGFAAHMGGTEIFKPLFETFQRRLSDLPLEVMLLTDGQVWNETQLFDLINERVKDQKIDARAFALGIGNGVSHSLVEGVARAGNGFAQFVTEDEDMEQKVVRMLKAALYAHTKEYQAEIVYADEHSRQEEDGFELVEKVDECLVIKEKACEEKPPVIAKTISFFDTTTELDKPLNDTAQTANRYAHLPRIDSPNILQAPADIPPLFPFNRTTLYLLLGPDTAQRDVKSIIIRAKSLQGPLELEIPIQGIEHGSSIHQLAARKAVKDLEEGRGWLQAATILGEDGEKLAVKEKHESRFDEIVEREAVVLGERFQVASKWTSFVAVETHEGRESILKDPKPSVEASRSDNGLFKIPQARQSRTNATWGLSPFQGFGGPQPYQGVPPPPPSGGLFGSATLSGCASAGPPQPQQSSLFGTNSHQRDREATMHNFGPMGLVESASRSVFGGFGNSSQSNSGGGLFAAPAPPAPIYKQTRAELKSANAMDYDDQGFDGPPTTAQEAKKPESLDEKLHRLIALQKFSGDWELGAELIDLLGLRNGPLDKTKFYNNANLMATALAVAYLEHELGGSKDVWEMVVDKARNWILSELGGDTQKSKLVIEEGRRVVGGG